ncbi:YIP1 family protein [Ferroacidibacillus organovorans]|uniref:Uncharacterized protein n=1 Tax=Ferroacidibacillus organovorans TaxID=1765683 RepID=A0A124IW17_9BACL|nr:YIP1 family protein [Ferroacidibacillus organovorans]KUO96020.1 hypothetical protein ATW55_02785 [Ferroacidibacillus organovorans]
MNELGTPSPFLTLITNPRLYFETRREQPRWMLLTLVLAAVTGVLSSLTLRYMMKSPSYIAYIHTLTKAQAAHVAAQAASVTPISAFAGVFVAVTVSAVFLWLIARIFSLTIEYRRVVFIMASATVISVLGTVFDTIMTFLTGRYQSNFLSISTLTGGTGRFGGIESALGLFLIGSLIIQTIGLAVFTRTSVRRSVWPVLGAYLLPPILSMIFYKPTP